MDITSLCDSIRTHANDIYQDFLSIEKENPDMARKITRPICDGVEMITGCLRQLGSVADTRLSNDSLMAKEADRLREEYGGKYTDDVDDEHINDDERLASIIGTSDLYNRDGIVKAISGRRFL